MSIRRKTWLTFLGILILAMLAGLVSWPKGPDINFGNIKKELKLHLGLDLQGGAHLVYEADLSKVEPENHEEAMMGVRDVIEKRVNALGVAEPIIQTTQIESHWRVIVELAGVFDINRAIEMIGQTPLLDFREQTDDALSVLGGKYKVEGEGENMKFVDQEGKEVSFEEIQKELEKGNEVPGFKLTKLSGQHLKKAQLQFDPQTNQPVVSLEFNDEGRKLFAEITERNVGKPLAIFLDENMISAPRVNEPIREGNAMISGQFTIDEAKELARRLNAGALPVPVTLISQTNVGASLGKASIEKSFFAGLVGLILVALFMILNYRFSGLLAVFALIIYTLIIIALFKLIPVTLTLAGIAGFILSVGMAVDANVLIFERIKEELRERKSITTAIDEGFKRAWGSIRDSNVSSLITCLILAWFGTSIIKGFAITLALGILVSMFSAITITRTFLRLFGTKWFEKRTWLIAKIK
jgi:protein-export membrane protein SecD